MHIHKSDDIVNKYNNTYHSTIRMKPVVVKPITYTESSREINYQDPKFQIDDVIRILKQKHFCKRLFSKLVWRSFCD